MRTEDFSLHVPVKKLLFALALTIIPLSLLAMYIVSQAETEVRRTVGSNFENIAVSSASGVSSYIHERVVQVGTLAHMPSIVTAVATANRAHEGVSETEFQDRVDRLEKAWNTPAAEPAIKQLLSSPASMMLRAQLVADPRLLRITLTDSRGAAIAATHKTLDYFQADESFWQGIYADGRGSVSLTDILYDEVTKTNYIGIGVPIMEPETNRFIGALDVLMDLASIFPVAANRYPGSSMQLQLIKEDGTVIAGTNATLSMKVKSPEWTAASTDLTRAPQRSGYLVTTLPDGREELVAYADTGLRDYYKNLAWTVIVTQGATESFAHIRGIVRLVLLFAFAGLAAVALLSVYFSLHRKVKYEDIATEMEEQAKANSRTTESAPR